MAASGSGRVKRNSSRPAVGPARAIPPAKPSPPARFDSRARGRSTRMRRIMRAATAKKWAWSRQPTPADPPGVIGLIHKRGSLRGGRRLRPCMPWRDDAVLIDQQRQLLHASSSPAPQASNNRVNRFGHSVSTALATTSSHTITG
jgi:hypothetical protein